MGCDPSRQCGRSDAEGGGGRGAGRGALRRRPFIAARAPPPRPRGPAPLPLPSPTAAAGEGPALRADPSSNHKTSPKTPTKLRSHRAAPGAPPRTESGQLGTVAAERNNGRPLPRRTAGGGGGGGRRGARKALSAECLRGCLVRAGPAHSPSPPAHALPAAPSGAGYPGRAVRPTGSQGLRAGIAEQGCPSSSIGPIGRRLGGALRLLRKAEVANRCRAAPKSSECGGCWMRLRKMPTHPLLSVVTPETALPLGAGAYLSCDTPHTY